MDYATIMRIDESNLEAEWLGQAARYMEMVEANADGQAQLDRLNDKLDVLQSTEAANIKKQLEAANEKVTEAAVNRLLPERPVIRALKVEIIDAQRQASIVRGAVTAMEHRKKALEMLVQMQLAKGRSEPSTQGATRSEVQNSLAQKRREANPIRLPHKK